MRTSPRLPYPLLFKCCSLSPRALPQWTPPHQRASQAGRCIHPRPARLSTPSAPHSSNLVGDGLGLGRGRLRGGRPSTHHLGGKRGGSVRTPGGGHAGAAVTRKRRTLAGAADARGSGRAESSAQTWRGGSGPCGRNHSARRVEGGNRDRKWGAGRPGREWSAGRPGQCGLRRTGARPQPGTPDEYRLGTKGRVL